MYRIIYYIFRNDNICINKIKLGWKIDEIYDWLKKCFFYFVGFFIGEKIGKFEGSKGCILAFGGNVITI